ncbi:hypothetical protein Q0M94_28155 (plasmid) [Deinococcus radiomollis]|uniref:hypothetical protein n=1 Tax=Deinococcus radiomollis TaxID=468916 RepID=UPI0038926519
MLSPPGERVSGFILPEALPVVADVEALPGTCALLTLADGSQVTVCPSDRPSLTPPIPEDVGLLTGWDKGQEGSTLYRVPADLSGRVAWALGCRPQTAPTLTGIRQTPNGATFTASQGGGYTCALNVPRGALMTLTAPVPGRPSHLTVTEQQAVGADARVFFFEVYPEAAAFLETLGLIDPVALQDTEA